MSGLRTWIGLMALAALPAAGEDGAPPTGAPATKAAPRTQALNQAFRGTIVKLRGMKVTVFYDFEDPAQLDDFEEARPPRLLDGGRNNARIEEGRLVLEGSTSIRHKLEGVGRLHATFTLNVAKKHNVGAVVTEPILSDFYVVYNLFDQRFNRNGAMHIGACGLREDEGAEDPTSGMVNFRDIFSGNLQRKVEVGRDVEVEIAKDGFKEFFRVGRVKGKGSSKGKTKDMKSYKFGLFVHESRAAFDDLTITFELTKEFLEYENLRAEVSR